MMFMMMVLLLLMMMMIMMLLIMTIVLMMIFVTRMITAIEMIIAIMVVMMLMTLRMLIMLMMFTSKCQFIWILGWETFVNSHTRWGCKNNYSIYFCISRAGLSFFLPYRFTVDCAYSISITWNIFYIEKDANGFNITNSRTQLKIGVSVLHGGSF